MAASKTQVRSRTASRAASRTRRHLRVRKKIQGSPERPRLVVTKSARHMSAQIIDDIAGWQVKDVEKDGSTFKQLQIDLKYGPNRERSIAGVRRVSKPGLRVYAKSNALPKVLGGLGVAIISTSTGLLTDRQAAKRGVGGEVLAYVW